MKIQTIGSLAIAAASLILNLGITPPVHAQQTEQPPAAEKQCEEHHGHHGHHGHKNETKQDDHHGDHHDSNHHSH